MWLEKLNGKPWTDLWWGYVVCGGGCPGIRKVVKSCPVCGAEPFDMEPKTVIVDGRERKVGRPLMGAEGSYDDYIYLQMLQREWERPAAEFERFDHFPDAECPSARAALVLLFWGYFETRIERLHRTAMRALPQRVLDDQLRRYSGIGSRIRELYKINFGTTYFDDLGALGYGAVADMLKDVHERRNRFAHGKPQAINDATVLAVVQNLKAEHEEWISVYNTRAKV